MIFKPVSHTFSMRLLSDRVKVIHGKLIIRCNGANLPGINDKLLDQDGKPLGRVYDIIGPIKSPWVIANLEKDALINNSTLIFVKTNKKKKRLKN